MPAKLAAAPWARRVQTLNKAGYARFDERTSTMLEDTAQRLVEKPEFPRLITGLVRMELAEDAAEVAKAAY